MSKDCGNKRDVNVFIVESFACSIPFNKINFVDEKSPAVCTAFKKSAGTNSESQ